jgi:tetratricopeptide (TPR) repeat protein
LTIRRSSTDCTRHFAPASKLVPRSVRVLFFLILAGFAMVARASDLDESSKALYRGEYQQAAQLAERFLQKFPNDARSRLILARANLLQGKLEPAFYELQKILTADPHNTDALFYLSLVAKAISQEEFQRLYALAPDSGRVHQLMGESASATENATQAEAEFLQALKTKPDSVEVLTELADLKRSQSKFEEAVEYYVQAEHLGPLTFDVAYGLGTCYTFKHDQAKAILYFRQAVTLDRTSAPGHFGLGDALFQDGQFEESVPEFKAAIVLEPRMEQAYFLLGRAYQKLNRRDQAKKLFEQLSKLNQN